MDVKIISNTDSAVHDIKNLISRLLAEKPVLFLLPGGSAANVGVAVLKLLSEEESKNIIVSLTDERYGPSGHDNSNWLLLESLGLPQNIAYLPVLRKEDALTTARSWGHEISEISNNHSIVALLGIGDDYHTAGIKPNYDLNTTDTAIYYEAKDFKRITISPLFFKSIDYSIIYTEGTNKADAIQHLSNDSSSLLEPMQLVKDSKSVLVYYKP